MSYASYKTYNKISNYQEVYVKVIRKDETYEKGLFTYNGDYNPYDKKGIKLLPIHQMFDNVSIEDKICTIIIPLNATIVYCCGEHIADKIVIENIMPLDDMNTYKKMISLGANKNCAAAWAAKYGMIEMIKYSFRLDLDKIFSNPLKRIITDTLFDNGYTDYVIDLVSEGYCDIKYALRYAIEYGCLEMVHHIFAIGELEECVNSHSGAHDFHIDKDCILDSYHLAGRVGNESIKQFLKLMV